jgi:acyl carrier protein
MDYGHILLRVREVLASLVDVPLDEISESTLLFEEGDGSLNMDSLDALKMSLALTEEYDLENEIGAANHGFLSVGAVARFLESALNGNQVERGHRT